jgi:TPR repeat protein
MAENGISHPMDLAASARLYQLSADRFPVSAACYGWCLRDGRGVPIDFTVAVEFFQQEADLNDHDGANSLGACLELGEGIAANIERAVWYYRSAAAGFHRDGLYNLGRCLEYGKGIGRDYFRAAKYYHLAAELGHAAAENSFGICLERGIGVQSNIALAARYYQQSANHGNADGANNIGFCLEHGRGVAADIALAAEYYKFAADHGHLEGRLNYRRCLRLLGRWEVPDRSSDVSCHPPARDDLAGAFIACLDDPTQFDSESAELITAIERLKRSRNQAVRAPAAAGTLRHGIEIGRGDSSVVEIERHRDGSLIAVKRPRIAFSRLLLEREVAIHRTLSHPLVIRFREFRRGRAAESPAILTEFAGNGSLAGHLGQAKDDGWKRLRGANRIARIAVGIALAMRYLHARGVVHRDLTPDNVLLDWDWNPRIADFGHSLLRGAPEIPSFGDQHEPTVWPSGDLRYLAPECYSNQYSPRSDVFSFAMILFELIVGQPGFPENTNHITVAKAVVVDEFRPVIPDWVGSSTRELINDCWAEDPDDRPSFEEIVERLREIDFKLTADVNSKKLAEFVERIEEREAIDSAAL